MHNKNKYKKNVFAFVLSLLLLIFFSGTNNLSAKIIPDLNIKISLPRFESSSSPELKRTKKIEKDDTLLNRSVQQSSASIQALSVNQSGPNLIANPGVENGSGNPDHWFKGGYGSNNRNLTYPVPGNNGGKAMLISVSNYSSGDAKWFFEDVPVTVGKTYKFSDYSKSDVQSIIDVRYKLNDGSYVYKDVLFVESSDSFKQNSVEIMIPPNVVSLTIFHLLNRNGNLTVDDYSLNEVSQSSNSDNLVQNGDFEINIGNSSPLGWKKGGWGNNTRSFSYPVTSPNGSSAVKTTITNYSNGDSKWYFEPISLSPGTYNYSDQYSSNLQSTVTIQLHNSDGSYTYKDLASFSPSASLKNASVNFTVGNNVTDITIFHLIQGIGSILLDNVSITKVKNPSGVFNTGAVTFRFDDGWLSQYENAIPKLNSYGMKGSFYIVSKQVADLGYPGFMSINQIQSLHSQGHEIDAHTRTHQYLTSLSDSEQQSEISGGREDILSWGGVGNVNSFAYPYGDYDSNTISIVKKAGFTSALSTLDGYVTPSSNKYELERLQPLSYTSFNEVKQWIDTAKENHWWLILSFHQINNGGDTYSVTPEMFNQIVDYVHSKNIPTVTIDQGLESF